MKEKKIKKLKELFDEIYKDTGHNHIESYLDLSKIDFNKATFDTIEKTLQDSGYFDVEIIYFTTAIEFLSENDNSLRDSLSLAEDMGFTPISLNSEILASILASNMLTETFFKYEDRINKLFDKLRKE